MPEVANHRGFRAELNDCREGSARIPPTEQIAKDANVCGRRNRKELSDTLNDAQNDCFENTHGGQHSPPRCARQALGALGLVFMRERTVGHSGLRIGEIGLGTLTWGRDTDETQAIGQLKTLLNEGGNLVDTSPAFGAGAAESLIGTLLSGSPI